MGNESTILPRPTSIFGTGPGDNISDYLLDCR